VVEAPHIYWTRKKTEEFIKELALASTDIVILTQHSRINRKATEICQKHGMIADEYGDFGGICMGKDGLRL